MVFCIETQTLKGISTAIYLVLTGEILPAGAGQGEEDFSAEKCTCKFGVNRVLHWRLSCIVVSQLAGVPLPLVVKVKQDLAPKDGLLMRVVSLHYKVPCPCGIGL